MKKRTICVLTGTRAEYGLLKPVMESIQAHPRLKLSLMVTGMHFVKEFGETFRQICKDGFEIDYKIKMHPKGDSGVDMSAAIGKGIQALAGGFANRRPDFLLLLGDRIEALAGAVAAAYMNIPVAHIHGGDTSRGGIDESARHAITKLANIHFPATRKSYQRIIKLGEKKEHVYCVGAPGLDAILNEDLYSKESLGNRLKVDFNDPVMLVLQHPVTTQVKQARKHIRETLAVVKTLKTQTIIVYPNSDAGGKAMIEEINRLKNEKYVRIFKNLPRKEYLSCLRYCSVLVGNSSSGVIESASFHLPVVNIGIRQEGRECSCNVLHVKHDRDLIRRAIQKTFNGAEFLKALKRCRSPYGEGKAGKRIAQILASVRIDENLLQKQIQY